MRLIALRFQGIGPYKDEFAIDFAALSRAHMFLIEGETGAGKTTILDAIVYALYGGVSGSEGKQRMRSRFLYDSDKPSWVDLIFEANGEYYRVWRSPDYVRPKRRGEGTTSIAAQAKLWHVDRGIAGMRSEGAGGADADRFFDYAEEPGHAQPLAARMKETSTEIIELLGLNRDQFAKTIMLAQGEFSRFLEMKPEDRTDLLKNLFGAQIYEDIQRDLHERAAKAKGMLDDDRLMLVNAIAMARDNAFGIDSVVDDDGAWCMDANGELMESALDADDMEHRLNDTLRRVAEASDRSLRSAQRDKVRADRALVAANERRGLVDRIVATAGDERKAVTQLVALKADDRRIGQIKTRLELSEKAMPIADRQRQWEESSDAQRRTQADLMNVRRRLDEYEAADVLTEQHARAVAAARDEDAANERRKALRSQYELLDALRRSEREHAVALQAVDDAESAHGRAVDELSALGDLADMEMRRRQIATLLGERGHREELVRQARAELDAVRACGELTSRLGRAQARHAASETAVNAARLALDRARDMFEQSDAAKYAAALRDGEPCPVCGSREHPNPAMPPDDVPTQDIIEAYEAQVSRCETAEREDAAAVTGLRTQRDDAAARLDGLDEQKALAQVDAAERALAEIDALRRESEALERQCEACRQAQTRVTSASTALAEARAAAQMAAKAMESARRAAEGIDEGGLDDEEKLIESRIAKAREQGRFADELADRIKRRDELQRQADALDATLRTCRERTEELGRQTNELCEQRGFADASQAIGSVLDDARVTELSAEVERHRTDMVRCETSLRHSRGELVELLADPICRDLPCHGPIPGKDGSIQAGGDTYPGTAWALRRDPDGPVAYGDDGVATALGDMIEAIDSTVVADEEAEAKNKADRIAVILGRMQRFEEERQRCERMVRERLSAWRATVDRFGPLEAMSELASGHIASATGQKVTLVTYAVTERFRDVLGQTNDILRDIHGGIYELRLGEREGRANARTGLPIDVVDHRTEQMRDPSTLSGGEKFFVSLALALGLARTIQAENGGMPMDTLFIDEGFGTLSEDYREDVMNVLRDIALRRDIGIISHVEALKHQIPERIRVSRVSLEGQSTLKVIA